MKACKLNVSHDTITRRLKEVGLKSYRLQKKPKLSDKNITDRLAFCTKYRDFSAADLKKVIFSDESNIEAVSSAGIRNVWRKREDKHKDFAVSASSKYPLSIMVFGAISPSTGSELHVLQGRLNAAGYRDILEATLMPFAEQKFQTGSFVFQQGNAPCHTAKMVSNFNDMYLISQ